MEVALKNWIEFVTGIQTKCMPYDGDRPSDDYMGYQIMAIVPMREGFKHKYELVSGNRYDWTRFTSAEMTVSINAYSISGATILAKLSASNDWWEARQVLLGQGDDIVFIDSTGSTNLTGLGDEKFRSRHQGNYRFNVTLKDERTIDAIKEWHLTGRFSNDTDTIDSKVDFITP